MLHFGSDFCLLKVSVKVQDKDFTVRPVSPMYGSEDLLFKGGWNLMSQIVQSKTNENHVSKNCTISSGGVPLPWTLIDPKR